MVGRVLDGIEQAQAARAQARALSAAPDEASPLLYPTLQRMAFSPHHARDRMMKAAAYLAVSAGLRPSELLGSSHAKERALKREQLKFFVDQAGTVPVAAAPGGDAAPAVLELTLRITKTSQLRAVTKLVKAPAAVAAVWAWFAETQARGPSALLFQLLPGGAPLSTFALCREMERRHEQSGLGVIRLTGKSWRRGGASTLAMLGYEAGDIAALGWTPDSHQWKRYASDPLVRRQRAIARGGLMQPAVESRPELLRSAAAAAARS